MYTLLDRFCSSISSSISSIIVFKRHFVFFAFMLGFLCSAYESYGAMRCSELKEHVFKATRLKIEEFSGDGIVKTHNDPSKGMLIDVRIADNELDLCQAYEVGNTLVIEVKKAKAGFVDAFFNIEMPSSTNLDLHLLGSGFWQINELNANSSFNIVGALDIDVDSINAKRLSIKSIGSNSFDLNKGNIGTLSVNAHGKNDINIKAAIGDLHSNVFGTGRLNIARLNGKIKQNNSNNSVKLKVKPIN